MTKYRILHIPTGAFCDITDKELNYCSPSLGSVVFKCVLLACTKTHCSLNCKDCSWYNTQLKLGFSEIEYFIEEIE